MTRSKIQDETEVKRWFEEGRTYAWMVEEYERKYDIKTSPSMWGNLRTRRGWGRRSVRDTDLIPWAIAPEHRASYELALLRMEARQRAGNPLNADESSRLTSWKERLEENGVVVHYDPETERGFYYVAPRPGIDTDLIRQPDTVTGRRAATP